MGCEGAARHWCAIHGPIHAEHLPALLQEERALSVLTGAMAAELTAAAVAEGMDAEGSWEGEAPEGPDVVKATAQEQPRREDV